MNTGLFEPMNYFFRRSRFWQRRYYVDGRTELLDLAYAYFIKAVFIWLNLIHIFQGV